MCEKCDEWWHAPNADTTVAGLVPPTCQAVESCEPRPRTVPEVGSGLDGSPTPLTASAVTRYGIIEPFLTEELQLSPDLVALEQALQTIRETAAQWLRGFNYEAIGEGHYADD